MKTGRLWGMRVLVILLGAMLLSACSPTASTAPSASTTASPSQPVSPTATPSPTSDPPPSPAAAATPTPSQTPTATPAFAACALPTWQGKLPSGRLVDVTVATTATADTVVFKFEPGGDNPGTPSGRVSPAKPPFSQSGSGQTIPVLGDQYLQVRFQKMTLEDAAGPVYTGKHNIKPGYPALRQIVNDDEFEGYSGWIVGMTKPTCVTMANDPTGMTLTLTIAHP